MRRLFAILILLGASLVSAGADEAPVTPTEFKAYAEGWTLHFSRDGVAYGSEHFLPDGRTVWRYSDGSCIRGAWRAHGAQLCFLYKTGRSAGTPLCWRVLKDDHGMIARLLTGDEAGFQLRVSSRDKQPLKCKEPATSA